ncbi:hypothetical protein LOK49_LG05G00470 [Camellia lanceoleosa]|uniref:Uncharacterized protein n=1 Tax=Camellia lanceoleosa TaxID=1840588 RepID=A0ACC0HPH7_9ERIC|nr:hypothetical protein LOK49_LG05G00470 [Camellia lanceoleosa]
MVMDSLQPIPTSYILSGTSDISTQLVVKVAWLCCIIHDILVSTIRVDFENMLENEMGTLAGITPIM